MKIEKQWENNRSKMISYIVFGAYLFLLTWLVLFKFAFTIEEIPHLRQLNLIPFHYETSVAFITHRKYTWQWGGSSALCISWKNIAKEENEHDQWNRSSG